MNPTPVATRAEREMRLIIESHRFGLGTPKITLQRIGMWADELAALGRAQAVYAESVRQLEAECQSLRAGRAPAAKR